MMNMEEFAKAILVAVRERSDGAFGVWITTVTKNNGVKLTGISTVSPDSSSGPCVYLDGYYNAYRQGNIGADSIAGDIYQQLVKHRDQLKEITVADFLRWDVIKHSVYAKLINADKNKERLENVPHRLFLDLAVVYYIKVQKTENGGTTSMIVRNPHMEIWGQDEESLYQMAAVNMRLNGKSVFQDMASILRRIPSNEINPFLGTAAGIKMYILTNKDSVFGAAEILDTNTLRAIGEVLGDDFIVLPSSIHETIILPSDHAPQYRELAEMVYEINRTQVDAAERLSDHVYRYDRNEGRLKIAA